MDDNVARYLLGRIHELEAELDKTKAQAVELMVKLKNAEDSKEYISIDHVKQVEMIRALQAKLDHLTNLPQLQYIGIPPYFVGGTVHEYWRFQ